MSGDMTENQAADPVRVRQLAERGVALCREGKLTEGYEVLKKVVPYDDGTKELPGVYYSYLGYCLAVYESRYNEGIKLCQAGVDREFYQAETYWNLARTYLLLDSRRKASDAIKRGLRVDPNSALLRSLRKSIGARKRPVIPWLARGNWLNRMLGKARHDWNNPKIGEQSDEDQAIESGPQPTGRHP